MEYRAKQLGKWVRRNRGAVAVVLAIAVFLGLPWLINNQAIVGVAATTRELPIYSVSRDNKCVSLTFDAAWGNVK